MVFAQTIQSSPECVLYDLLHLTARIRPSIARLGQSPCPPESSSSATAKQTGHSETNTAASRTSRCPSRASLKRPIRRIGMLVRGDLLIRRILLGCMTLSTNLHYHTSRGDEARELGSQTGKLIVVATAPSAAALEKPPNSSV